MSVNSAARKLTNLIQTHMDHAGFGVVDRERNVTALERIAHALPSTRTVDVIDENNKWRFAPGVSAGNHFWSTDGAECLWCARQRSVAEITAWFDAGKPDEVCAPL